MLAARGLPFSRNTVSYEGTSLPFERDVISAPWSHLKWIVERYSVCVCAHAHMHACVYIHKHVHVCVYIIVLGQLT